MILDRVRTLVTMLPNTFTTRLCPAHPINPVIRDLNILFELLDGLPSPMLDLHDGIAFVEIVKDYEEVQLMLVAVQPEYEFVQSSSEQVEIAFERNLKLLAQVDRGIPGYPEDVERGWDGPENRFRSFVSFQHGILQQLVMAQQKDNQGLLLNWFNNFNRTKSGRRWVPDAITLPTQR